MTVTSPPSDDVTPTMTSPNHVTTGNLTSPIVINSSQFDNVTAATAARGGWQINFFSVFIEHPGMRGGDRVYLTFRMISLALLLPAGLLGNALTVAVMRRPRMRKQTISLTLLLLAVSDGCCLLIRGLLWVNLVSTKGGYPLPVRFDSDAACSYLPVISRYQYGVVCVTKIYPDMLVHFVLATTCVSMAPLSLIALCNIAIVFQLTCQSRKGPQHQLTRSEGRRSEMFRRVTNMVLSVSFAFLVTVFPQAANAMMRILRPHWLWLKLTDDICAVLWDFNYAINVYLYVITGRTVRAELRQMLGCGGGGGKSVANSVRASSFGTEK